MGGVLFGELEAGDRPGRVYARVAVERGIDRIDDEGTLTYGVAGEAPRIGQRVRVPLGRRGTLVPGVVIATGGRELLDGLSPAKVKDVARVEQARLPEEMLALGRWMAAYYLCPLGMVLSAMVPAAVKRGTGRRSVEVVRRLAAAEPPSLTPALRRAWQSIAALAESAFPMPLKVLAASAGLRGPAAIRRLAVLGLLVIEQREVVRAAQAPVLEGEGTAAPTPTAEQAAAVEGVVGSLGAFAVHLLRGVTGSGKTEVYLRVIAEVLGRGKGAIVLVPEIALTPQTAARFLARFGAGVAVLHSGLTGAQRHQEWSRAAGGEARVVVGARSAVFAPVPGLGLVVVDEEHDASYKQDQLPRYSARDVAIKRAHLSGCPVILGSATPSLESWRHATGGRYRLWELRGRVGGARLPEVTIVDMRAEHRARRERDPHDQRVHLLGPTLEGEIARTLRAGGQVMVLHNRRGFASYIWCRNASCRNVVSCDHCDANLVVHRHEGLPPRGVVRCHHCEAEQRVPSGCPVCGGHVALWGGGTQRAEVEFEQKFMAEGLEPGKTMLRLDSDSMRGAGEYHRALSRFARGEVRLLLGTQMIAKGLDFPDVRLVGIIDADLSLLIPDFRSAERTFQLVSQVAGRAGRGLHAGRVIVQTMNPESPAIVLAAGHDFASFAAFEMASRERAGLPPFSRMANIVCRDRDLAKARAAAGALAEVFGGVGVRVRGPMPCVISRIAGFHRVCVTITADSAGALQRALSAARARGILRSDAHTAVDVDPVSLM